MNDLPKPERILVFELNWLGDILFSFPFLKSLREAFPGAYIACVVVPRYADLLVNNPWINDVHFLSDARGIRSLLEKIKFVSMIRKEGYDTCFMLKPSKTKALMSVFAGIGTRIGFEGKESSLTASVEMPKGEVHRVDQILSLAGTIGIVKASGSYEYFMNEIDEEKAAEVLHVSGGGIRRMVALNPGGNWDAKRWPAENYAALAKKILSDFTDVEIVVTGARKDTAIAAEIVREVSSKRCYSVAGKTTLNELAAIFRKCVLVISADSGPLHLASASGAVTVGLFGPTSYKITGPRGKNNSIIIQKDCGCVVPCYVSDCKKAYVCMRSITVDEVYRAAWKVISPGKR